MASLEAAGLVQAERERELAEARERIGVLEEKAARSGSSLDEARNRCATLERELAEAREEAATREREVERLEAAQGETQQRAASDQQPRRRAGGAAWARSVRWIGARPGDCAASR